MRILSVHNRYQVRGGEDECYEAEINLLRQNGHSVISYEDHNDRIKTMPAVQLAARTIWSQGDYTRIRRRLAEQPIDVVHVQNFFPLISPAVYYAAQAEQVPVVQTLHNYRLLCPNALFFRDGKPCEDCLGKALPVPSIHHGCYQQSRVASAVTTAMLSTHRALGSWQDKVDIYIALTQFARQKFVEGGLPADRIVVKPHFISPDPGPGTGQGKFALYVGRLSVEKGLDIVIEAWQSVGSNLPLKIVGDGPLADFVTEATQKFSYIEYLGRQPLAEVYALMGEATCLIFPSKWYETFGRVAIEAFAKGTPVIGAKHGAIEELIDHGRTGLHFNPGDANHLAEQVLWCLANPQTLAEMRVEARREFEKNYGADLNLKKLTEIYQKVAADRKN